jgi:methionine synthase II (cobalamin-independent)
MRIGNEEVLLPTTMVGNYPNPRWYDGRAFAKYPGFPAGELVFDSIAKEALEDAVLAIAHDQEHAGLDVIADGRVYGGDSPYGQILYHYVERMNGYDMHGPNIGLPIYSSLYAPTCVGEVSRRYPFNLETLRAVRKATDKPVKVSYTGIQVLALATNNQHYKETRDLALAIARAFNEDFKELADNGVDIIQLDEFVWPYGMGDWEVEALNRAVEGVGAQFWVHVCWGNYSGTPAYLPMEKADTEFGAYILDRRPSDAAAPERAWSIFPKVMDANIDALNYEVGRTGADDLKPLLEYKWDKPFVAGVIDVKTTITETAAEVADRIRQVLEYVPAERLGLSTDCGLINLPRMIGASKLRALADGAAMVREDLQSK